jgi:uncharacterized protein with FMN-binding domain
MSNNQTTRQYTLVYTLRKYFVSAFVVFSFVAYALHEQQNEQADGKSAVLPTQITATETRQTTVRSQPSAATPQLFPTTETRFISAASPQPPPPAVPTDVPTAVPTDVPTVTPSGLYRDGEYTGISADAFYGLVQVKAFIQGGKITDVQFVDYPHDRRTSQRINNEAMPYLKYEAIQTQNANVDLVSGATLTSQAFVESLQTALDQAKVS